MTPRGRILVVDDDLLFTALLDDDLSADGFEVEVTHTLAGAENKLREEHWGVLLLDIRLPDGSGLELVRHLSNTQRVPIILVTAQANIGDAVTALDAGVHDYLIKPVDLQQLRFSVMRSLEMGRKERAAELAARERERTQPKFTTRSPHFAKVLELAARAAKTKLPVLLTGETGTGKTRMARQLHAESHVSDGPFVSLNCGVLPASLVEGELFGAEAGAYTGAKARPGLFELASGGSLFLDEVTELSLSGQATLLSAIEDKRIRRVGGARETPIDVRVIAATNVALSERVREGGFRADLFYRLDVVSVALPPLRDRLEDLPALVDDLLVTLAPARTPPLELAPDELDALRRHGWPGNIRELRNVLERALLFSDGKALRPAGFLPAQQALGEAFAAKAHEPLRTLADVERAHILHAIEQHGGKRQHAADALGISTATLRRRLADYRRQPPS